MRNVVIVGGGSAGWMSAAFLSKVLGSAVDITLVESSSIATVGVGEATIPPIQMFNRLMGIDEASFMRSTQATIKLGIQFENWGHLGDRYQHAFGPTGTQVGLTPFLHYWLRGRQLGHTHPLGEYSFNAMAATAHKFEHSRHPTSPGNPTLAYAYHFDATAYANVLKEASLALGVKHCTGTINNVQTCARTGNISTLHLDNGRQLTADLFIDCSGMRSLLLGQTLQVPYESWQHWLPCDSAIALQTDAKLNAPYTRSIAHSTGWQWQIPLQNRTGNGAVYSSSYCNEADALSTLEKNITGKIISQPNAIRFNTGRYTEQWRKNCIAIGLSSGFLEPLESTSLHMVQSSLVRLVKLFPRHDIQETSRSEFNRQAEIEAEGIRDFIILHYHQNQRTDSDFWQQCRTMSLPQSLLERINTFADSGYLFRRNEELFDENAWTQVLIGQGLIPNNYHPLADDLSNEKLDQFLASLRAQTLKFSTTLTDHTQYIKKYCQKQERTHYA